MVIVGTEISFFLGPVLYFVVDGLFLCENFLYEFLSLAICLENVFSDGKCRQVFE